MGSLRTRIEIVGRDASIKRRTLMAMRGIPSHVPGDPVREHIAELREIGFNDAMIARAAGLPQKTIWNVRTGVSKTVRILQAAAIMRVDHKPRPDLPIVVAVGLHRRIRALGGMGWSHRYLAERLGITEGGVRRYMLRDLCRYETWAAVSELYDELSMTPGPHAASVGIARGRGWHLPLEWEGYDIDDPRVTPERSRRGKTDALIRDPEITERRRAKVAELTRLGYSASEIAAIIGVSERQVVRHRMALRGEVAS